MVKKVKDLKWNIEYLWDDDKKEPFKYLVNFHTDGTSTVDKMYYEYNGDFTEPYEVATELDGLIELISNL